MDDFLFQAEQVVQSRKHLVDNLLGIPLLNRLMLLEMDGELRASAMLKHKHNPLSVDFKQFLNLYNIWMFKLFLCVCFPKQMLESIIGGFLSIVQADIVDFDGNCLIFVQVKAFVHFAEAAFP